MAKKKRKGPSRMGIFKKYFQEHPDWVKSRSNDAVMAEFAKDNPGVAIDKKVKQSMFNAKNFVKRGGKKGTKGQKRKVAAMQAAIAGPRRKGSALQMLENHVDDCLAMARQFGTDEISDVIAHLHRARNILVFKIES